MEDSEYKKQFSALTKEMPDVEFEIKISEYIFKKTKSFGGMTELKVRWLVTDVVRDIALEIRDIKRQIEHHGNNK